MSSIPQHFQVNTHPKANADAVIEHGNARFTVLTGRLIRLEYHPEGLFTDQATQAFWFREQPVPEFTTTQQANTLTIETEYLLLEYATDSPADGFTADNLKITLKSTGVVWTPDSEDTDNLLGTTRTLDKVNGYVPLEKGLLSRAGWSVIDDSTSLILNDDGWIEPRTKGGTDLYFFGYGQDYRACLQDYCRVSGQMPLIPRWILGNWWSRYHAYSQDELKQLILDFEKYELPFSVLIIDMDWHITKTDNDSTGWTGYTWNLDLFPDPQGMLNFAHDHELKIAMNLHPAEGVHNHETQYEDMARAVGIDPASGEPVKFRITDPEFAQAYFEILHHPYEKIGTDFWWIDWQQGQKSEMEGLDPLWLINHLHFYDLGRDGIKRPFIFSRWGREGHQRYPIGFSGDSYISWDTLNFQPYMTATASNIAYGWWSHDIGGHTNGIENTELLVRSTQLGTFSPINRQHVTTGYFYDRRPWLYEDHEVLSVMRDALQLRHALVPYIYTMARRAYDASLPLVQPMYYEYPTRDEAYHVPQQYLFGTELMVAPFVSPKDAHTGLSKQVVWLPEGEWYQVFSGEHYSGDRWQSVYGTLRDIPVFAKAGAIVPFAIGEEDSAHHNPSALQWCIFAGADGEFTLYEDDGTTTAYREDDAVRTTIRQAWQGDQLIITVEPAQGDLSLIPDERDLQLSIYGVTPEAQISASIDGESFDIGADYDSEREILHLNGISLSSDALLSITVKATLGALLQHRDRTRETLLRYMKFFKLNNHIRNDIAKNLDAIIADPLKLGDYAVMMHDNHLTVLCEVLFDAGVHAIYDTAQPAIVVMWNNSYDDRLRYRYNEGYANFFFIEYLNQERGTAPRYQAIVPRSDFWRYGVINEHVMRTQWQIQLDYANIFACKISQRHSDS